MEKRKSTYKAPPVQIRKPVLTEQQLEELREIFSLFCTSDSNGKADPNEMRVAARTLGIRNSNPTIYAMIMELTAP